MKLLPIFHLILCALCAATNVSGQKAYDCNGEILIATNDGNKTIINRQLNIPFSPPLFTILASYTGSFDALGFNPKDNFLYGVEQKTNNIVRLSLYNTFERIGRVSIVDTIRANAGDCTADGFYVYYDYRLNQMLVFDVENGLNLVRRINLFWDPTSPNKGPFTTRIFDFAFDPNDTKTAYSYQGNFNHPDLAPIATQGYMLKINLNFDDPNVGMVTPLSNIDRQEITHISGLAFDPSSNLYGYGSGIKGINPLQSNYFNINQFQGQISPILYNTPAQILSDACSCPFSLVFLNAVPSEGMFCNNETKSFIITLVNNSYLPINSVLLKDTLPEGTVIKSISKTFNGKLDAGTGIGTNILSISELEIPAKGKVVISMEVMSVNANDGPAYNRAYLFNLPQRFPSIIASDDPNSTTPNDRSNFFFKSRELNNITWKIVPPTDCIEANDGKIIVSSSEFMPGQNYEVGLRNKIGWKEYFSNVTIDEKNSFTIDSLIPGEYQLFKFRFISDNCSLSLKDTTILLDAPNDLLELNVKSNSPVCEGASIFLNSTLYPSGQIYWTGPAIFGSEGLNPIIENAAPNRSGTYEAKATYGYCTQKKTLDVDIRKQVNITLEGQSSYCVRDTIRLEALSKEPDQYLTNTWLGPNEITTTNAVLTLPIVDNSLSGVYTAIATNGACLDTAMIEITVQPTPTLTLDGEIMSDFCDPLVLSPSLTDDMDVFYQWFPTDGLSCTDCPNPQIKPIVKSNYKLTVRNRYDCRDSAAITIILDKSSIAFTPNIFSPKATNANQQFKIFPNCVVRYIQYVDIYDRYGSLIFHSSAQSENENLENWDGLSFGKTVSSGVYVWFAKVELVDGSIAYLSGDVTVL